MERVHPTQPRRVKVYTLEGDKWIDKGTGYCTGELTGGPNFVVRDEDDSTEILLRASIEGSIQYQRQQDTLIVWTDSEGNDYALSFQEPEGCLLLCKFLVSIQHTIEPNISLVAVVSNGEDGEITEVIAGPVPEPCIPQDDNLPEVLDLLNQGSKSPKFRETLLHYIKHKDYLKKLLETFHRNEGSHNLDNLHYLCDIVKTLIFYNDPAILETFLDGDAIVDVLGTLEYDPEFPKMKTNNREYLARKIRFREVVPVVNEEVKELMKKTFRLQFLKDVVLARLLDDATFNCISNQIRVNEERILKFITTDRHFLSDLFGLFNEVEIVDKPLMAKRREAIRSLHQFVLVAKKLQPFPRTRFFKSLIEKGLFKAVQFALKAEHQENSRILATEVMVTIIEHDVFLFRKSSESPSKSGFRSRDAYDKALIDILTDILIKEPNIGLKTQAFEALKVILDPSNTSGVTESLCSSPATPSSDSDLNSSSESFLESFYKNCARRLFEPLIKLRKEDGIKRGEYVTYSALCELTSFIAREHDRYYSRSFIIDNRLLEGVAALMGSKHAYQLRISALRCLKIIILLDDDSLTHYIVENDILGEFVLLLMETNKCNNLINSVCLNLLEILIQNDNLFNFQVLRDYLVRSYGTLLDTNFLGKELVRSVHAHGKDATIKGDATSKDMSPISDEEDGSDLVKFGTREDEDADESADVSSLQPPVELGEAGDPNTSNILESVKTEYSINQAKRNLHVVDDEQAQEQLEPERKKKVVEAGLRLQTGIGSA